MKQLFVLVSIVVTSSIAFTCSKVCLKGYCDGDSISMLSPPKPGRVLKVNRKSNTITIKFVDGDGKEEIKELNASNKDFDHNLRHAQGCLDAGVCAL